MKKLRYLLVLLIAFTIIGCGGGNTDDSADDSATIPTQGDDATPNNPAQDDEQTPDESTVVSYSTISFDSNGGSDVSSIRVVQGEEVSEPTEPTYEGMTFVCWCYDEELSEKVEWPLVVDKNYTLYAKWNVEVDIVAYLETLLDYQIFNPYNMIPETLKPGYSSNVVSKSDYDFSSSVNVSSMPGNGHGEQWNMVVENLEQSQTFFNVLSVVETVSTSSVVIFQNYFDENPSEVANYSFKNGEYNVCVIFDGQYISYVLDYVANIPLLGEQKVQILLSMDVESGERIVRIQLGDSNALRYTVLDGYYEFAIKYLGVRTAYFSLYYDDEDILNGHIYENLLVEGVGLKSAADFYISDTYATIVGNKSSGLIGFTGYIVELYDVVTGKLISYEVMETQTISSVNVTFNTLWFDLHDVGGINSVKFVAAETNDDDDLFYINGSSSAWENKTVGVSGGLKIASRRFDIEFRTQYFYQYNNETEEYEKVSIKVPMLFVQEEVFDDAISDIKSKNNITVTFGVATDDLEKLMADYDTTIEVFIEHKDVVTEASIIEFIGEAIEFN